MPPIRIYGSAGEIQVVMSRLSRPVYEVRPGGETVNTKLGETRIFEDPQGAQAMIFLTDELVLNLHAPNRLTVLDVLAALKPVN